MSLRTFNRAGQVARIYLLGILAFLGVPMFGADLDSLREPIVRPNEETVKKWLHGLEITVEKRSLWFDRKEKLDSTKVRDHAVTGGSIFQKPTPFANYGITTRSFGYPDGKGKANRYVVVIEYEWSAGLTGID